MRSAGQGDDQARFLSDLRALRDMAAIGYDELAARAHYPSDVLKEAENGPLLPGLPVLTAYVRACEGDVLDWEERWRELARVVAEDPGLPVRPPGASPAAVAGARAGVGIAPPDVYDPERIRAALRGGHERPQRNGRKNGHPGIAARRRDTEPAGWDADPGQDVGGWPDSSVSAQAEAALGADPDQTAGTSWSDSSGWDSGADPTVTIANGNHSPGYDSHELPETAVGGFTERDGQTDQFRWLPEAERESGSNDADFTWSGHQEAAETDAPPAELATSGRPLREQEEVRAQPERNDFWSTPAPPAPADLQLPTASPRQVEEPTAVFGSAPSAQTDRTPAAASQQPATDSAPSLRDSTSTSAQASAEPARHEKDRFFPVRLLVIIIIAALIGSALVLLLK